MHAHRAEPDLALQRLIGADQELLAGLASGVKRARDQHPTERAVIQQAALAPGEWHALRHALIDDAVGHLRQPVDVRFAAAEIARP